MFPVSLAFFFYIEMKTVVHVNSSKIYLFVHLYCKYFRKATMWNIVEFLEYFWNIVE